MFILQFVCLICFFIQWFDICGDNFWVEPMFHIFCRSGFLPFLVPLFKHYRLRWGFQDFKLQLTHCCQVFPGQPCSHLPVSSCCVHFFIQLLLQQTWPNQCKWFVVFYLGPLNLAYLINYQMIFCHWSLLCISSKS